MGARRIKRQKNEAGLKRFISGRPLKLLASGLVLVAVALFVNNLFAPATLPFKTIQVYGELQWLDREELNRLVLRDLNGGFFSLDVGGLKQNLEQYAWIKAVSIRRVWPDVLQILVTEQQPVAVWNHDSIINREGELFAPVAEQFPEGLAAVNGPPGTHRALIKHFNALSQMAGELGLAITDITLNDRRAMQVTLSNGLQLLMGRVRNETESATEMLRFVRAYKATLAPQSDRIQVVDLRYTNGLAVRWKRQALLQGKKNYNHNNNKNASEAG
ncbi:MAG: cell division protein FtsQ/DivIB [Gammaproteobacteria bacterium]|nr:cell division protein FtsQ/DivIB [Gammaproteobacteria bacterium]